MVPQRQEPGEDRGMEDHSSADSFEGTWELRAPAWREPTPGARGCWLGESPALPQGAPHDILCQAPLIAVRPAPRRLPGLQQHGCQTVPALCTLPLGALSLASITWSTRPVCPPPGSTRPGQHHLEHSACMPSAQEHSAWPAWPGSLWAFCPALPARRALLWVVAPVSHSHFPLCNVLQ